MSDPKRTNAKHVSRACLGCRQRHLKCDGQLPVCGRCQKDERDCNYVKSNRGGSRKKGVKKVKLNDHHDGLSLPCVLPSGEKSCPNGRDHSTCGFLNNGSLYNLPCQTDESRRARTNINIESNSSGSRRSTSFLAQEFQISHIIHNYYSKFHSSHPVLPSRKEIEDFLIRTNSPRELLAVMKLIGDGYTSFEYSKNINVVLDIAMEVSSFINTSAKDVISLQALILLSLACHISSLHDMSTSLRKQAIQLALHLDINHLDMETFTGTDINGNLIPESKDQNNAESILTSLTPTGSSTDEINFNFFNTQRVRNVDEDCLKDCARRCFWELFFLDIIIGCSDGTTVSKFTSIECFTKFPTVPSRNKFDYETRSYTSKLVDESVRLNNFIFSNVSIGQQYSKLTAALSNWELKFSNPDFYKLPYLIDENGEVNEGIQQGIIMINYAKIFTHRPLSFLWRSDVPKNVKCVELLNEKLSEGNNENCQDIPNQKDMINSRKIIETRKTIDAANLIAKTLIDTNPINILKRTPLNACSLAFAGLIHLSAYLWSSQVVEQNNDQSHLNPEDLSIYEEYIKLELSGIYQISSHWYLSSKIANYLMDSIAKLLPNLYKKIESHFKEFAPANQVKKPISQPVPPPPPATTSTVHHSPSSSSSTERTSISGRSVVTESPSVSSVSSNINKILENPISFNIDMPYEDNNNNPVPANDPLPSNIIIPEEPLSPQSDSGCNWIDKNQLDFEFNNLSFPEFDIDSINAIDDMIKRASNGIAD